MGYTIFTREQVLTRTRTVPGPFGQSQVIANAGPAPAYPVGSSVFYSPEELDIYSPDPACRRVLLADPAGVASEAEIMAAFPAILDDKKNRLWSAASAWERRNISGVALSLLTLGVARGLPKALAIANWSNALWNGTYYPRKAAIRFDTEPDCDFSGCGDMPHSVPELSAEVWGQ